MAIRYNFEETQQIVREKSECELIDCWYENGRKQLKLLCKCGNVFQTDWRQFNRKDSSPVIKCKDCRRYKKIGDEYSKSRHIKSKYVGTIVGDFFIIDNFNENGKTRYKVRCIHCNRIEIKSRTAIDHGICECQKIIRNCDRSTRLGKIYHYMLQRCLNPKCIEYKNYGGRGIKVCDEWQTFPPFKEWALKNGYRDDLSIDRIDVNGNYEPNNCRWATYKQQALNKRTNHTLTYNGITKAIKEWADEIEISQNTLLYRIRRGWNVEKALTTPLLEK